MNPARAIYIVRLLAEANSNHLASIRKMAIEAVSIPDIDAEIKCTPEALETFIGRCSQGYVERDWKIKL